jgi:hypothetical protein
VNNVPEMTEAINSAGDIDPWECRREAENRFSAERMFQQYLFLYYEAASLEAPHHPPQLAFGTQEAAS